MDRIYDEPVLVLAVVEALLGFVVAFGLDLSGEQTAAVMALGAAVLGLVARQKVTPVNRN